MANQTPEMPPSVRSDKLITWRDVKRSPFEGFLLSLSVNLKLELNSLSTWHVLDFFDLRWDAKAFLLFTCVGESSDRHIRLKESLYLKTLKSLICILDRPFGKGHGLSFRHPPLTPINRWHVRCSMHSKLLSNSVSFALLLFPLKWNTLRKGICLFNDLHVLVRKDQYCKSI